MEHSPRAPPLPRCRDAAMSWFFVRSQRVFDEDSSLVCLLSLIFDSFIIIPDRKENIQIEEALYVLALFSAFGLLAFFPILLSVEQPIKRHSGGISFVEVVALTQLSLFSAPPGPQYSTLNIDTADPPRLY